MVVTLSQQYDVGEKPTVILYTYINRHAGTPKQKTKTKQKQCSTFFEGVVIMYDNSAIEPYSATIAAFSPNTGNVSLL